MKLAREDGLLRVTLDRPEQRNMLTASDCVELCAACAGEEANAVLIEAAGPYFCAGLEPGVNPGRLFDAATWANRPVICAVQGPAIDEGVALMACAHVVVAAQGASFALTQVRQGCFPETSFPALARAIGHRRALEIALTGRVFTTQDALAWGLIHQVAPPFEFDDRAEAIARALASKKIWPPAARC